MSRSLKTTRNLSQFAEKKLVGKSHTSAQKTDNAEGIPSNVQISTNTIFGQAVPDGPSNAPTETLYAVTSSTVQFVQFDVTEIGLTTYDADSDTQSGGDDSPQGEGPHAWSLSLPSNYESSSTTGGTKHHSKVGTAPFQNSTRVFDTLGALQLVPTNVYINTSNVANNPYIAKIYVWDGSNNSSKEATPLSTADHVDWFVDYYSGVVFFQEYNGKVPYKVEAFIYVGDMADQTTGGTTTLAGLTDTNIAGVSNNQILAYNASNSKWEAQNPASGGIERYQYVQTSGNVSANTAITIPGMNFNGATPTLADTKVFLNGQLLVGGSQSDLNSSTVDYHFSSDTQIKLVSATDPGDILAVFHTTTTFSTGKDILLHTDDAAFNNGRVITAGDGISISVATPRQLIINNTGLIQRSKTHVTSSTSYSTNDVFTVTGVDFSSKSYSDDRIDIFLGGTLLIKGVGYQLRDQVSTLSTSQFKLIGSTSISNGDIVTAILF